MKINLILDRVEESSVAVLTDDNCKVYECSVSLLPEDYRESDAFLGELDSDGRIVSLEKTEKAEQKNQRRLRGLFNKNKDKSKLK